MERLQAAESRYHILLAAKFLSLGHQSLFLAKIFLEIIVTQLLVDLKLVIIFFHSVLIALPEIARKRSRHLAYLLELCLQIAHLLEKPVGIVNIGTHFGDLVNDSLLAVVVLLLESLYGRTLLGLFLFDSRKQSLEALLSRISLRLKCLRLIAGLNKSLALAALLLVAYGIELLLKARHLICRNL